MGKRFTIVVLFFLCVGCSGGGGGGGASAPNQAPLADAGGNQAILISTGAVELDGSKSADPEGAPLQYAWAFTLMPSGSAATLSDANAPRATFMPDVTGLYRVQLAVSDGSLRSTASADVDVAVNPSSVANAGADQQVDRGAAVTLDGSASRDPLSRPLSYTWMQIANGCPDVTGGAGFLSGLHPVFAAPDAICTLAFSLRVNNGSGESFASTVRVLVLEEAAHAIFVSGSAGDDANPGTRASPKATLAAAVAASLAGGFDADIYVSNTKTYSQCTLGLPPRVSLYGGYDANWERVGARTLLASSCAEALAGSALANQTVAGMKIVAAPGAGSGQSSYGMHLNLAGNVSILDNEIAADAGANGFAGATQLAARVGTGGTPGAFGNCGAVSDVIGGPGGGGAPGASAGGAGGKGGGAADGNAGAPGGGALAGSGGNGGFVGNPGTAGANGRDGGNGIAGSPGVPGAGTFSTSYFVASGGQGASGGPGSGGGGGGGGGGKSFLFFQGTGNGGGGGGGGGEGGRGGFGGQGGGGSFALYLSGTGTVQLLGNVIAAGNGGGGGVGSAGAPGGTGGAGAAGGINCTGDVGAGGNGGRGGAGGKGGSGAGGGGGPSMGVAHAATVAIVDASNTITVGAGGAAGAGGPGAGSGASGSSAPVFGF